MDFWQNVEELKEKRDIEGLTKALKHKDDLFERKQQKLSRR